jgi:hypothetical protein
MTERKAPRKQETPDPESEAWNKLPWRKLEQHVTASKSESIELDSMATSGQSKNCKNC